MMASAQSPWQSGSKSGDVAVLRETMLLRKMTSARCTAARPLSAAARIRTDELNSVGSVRATAACAAGVRPVFEISVRQQGQLLTQCILASAMQATWNRWLHGLISKIIARERNGDMQIVQDDAPSLDGGPTGSVVVEGRAAGVRGALPSDMLCLWKLRCGL
ncbi:unnamed protein product [Phaeothamnion confervicola]